MSPILPKEFPPQLWTDICETDQADHERCEYLAGQAAAWADGRHPDDLGVVLDALRAQQAYGVSIQLLEAGWNSSAPEPFRAQIAQDWVGTVLFGIGDPDGAVTVAKHINKTSEHMSAAFLSDFADVLMEWGLLPAAFPILRDLVKRLPGDLSVKYNLGSCHKFRSEWSEAKECFLAVDQHKSTQLPLLHNILLAALATGDQPLALRTQQRIEKHAPSTDWHLNKVIQVELAATDTDAAEVLYALRVAPHLVRLRGIPNRQHQLEYDDLLLVDFQAQRYGDDAQTQPDQYLFPILGRIKKGDYQTHEVATSSESERTEAMNKLLDLEVPARTTNNAHSLVIAVNASNLAQVQQVFPQIQNL